MKSCILILLTFLVSTVFGADVKISNLPLGTGSSVGLHDSFPYVDATTLITKRLTLYDIANVPLIAQTYAPLIAPTFTGTVTVNGPIVFGLGTDSTTTGSNAQMTTSTRSVVQLTNASLVSLKSIATTAVPDGYRITLVNATGGSVTLVDSGTPSGGYAALTSGYGSNLTLPNLGAVTYQYKSSISKWLLNSGTHLVPLASAVSGTLPVANGGTGATTLASHGVLVGNGTGAVSVTATGSAGQLLTSNGASADPTFTTATFPTTATSPAALVVNTNDTVTALSGSTANRLLRTNGSAVSFSQANLTTDVTGTLPVTNGGTGAATLTAHGVLLGNGTGVVSATSAGTSGQALISGGASVDSAFGTLGISGGGTGQTSFSTGALSSNGTSLTSGTLSVGNGGTGQTSFSSGALSSNGTSLTSGTLSVANGGTGLASGTSGGVLAFTASGTISSSGALTANQLIVGGGAGVAPSSLAAGSQYQVLRMGAANPAYGSINLDQSAAVTGSLPVANGGTGLGTLTTGNVILGAGTSNVTFVAPGTSGNVLTSNGSTWTSAAATGGGGVPSILIYSTSTQAIAHTSTTKLTYPSGTNPILTGFTYSTGTFTSTKSQSCQVTCSWEKLYSSDASTVRWVLGYIYVNGAAVPGGSSGYMGGLANNAVEAKDGPVNATALVQLSTNDTFECYAYQSNASGTSYNTATQRASAVCF